MDYVADAAEVVTEVMPWDLDENSVKVRRRVLDIREPYEFDCMHIDGSHNVPCSGHQERARFLEFALILSLLFNSAILQLSCHNANYVQFIVLLNEEAI